MTFLPLWKRRGASAGLGVATTRLAMTAPSFAAIIKAATLVSVAMPASESSVDDGRSCSAHVPTLSFLSPPDINAVGATTLSHWADCAIAQLADFGCGVGVGRCD